MKRILPVYSIESINSPFLSKYIPPMSSPNVSRPLILWWVKRDLRIRDNAALSAARQTAGEQGAALAALYVLDDAVAMHPETSMHHARMIDPALDDLHCKLEALGIPLLYARAEMTHVIAGLEASGWQVRSVHSHEETGTAEGYARDVALGSFFADRNIPWHEEYRNGVIRRLSDRERRIGIFRRRMGQDPLVAPASCQNLPGQAELTMAMRGEFLDPAGSLADLAWKTGRLLADLEDVAADPASGAYAVQLVRSLQRDIARFFPDESDAALVASLRDPGASGGLLGPPDFQAAGETAAERTLQSFFDSRGEGYSGGMSSMNSAPEHCSRFSVHLAWGSMSMRMAMRRCDQRLAELKAEPRPPWGKSLRSFQRRLHWHDHFSQRLEDEPEIEFYPINRAYRGFSLPDDWQERFWSWILGTTGYPYVDACIRHFRRSGYLSFRARAMITSFAIHDLRLPWRLVLYPMAQMMADYVPGIHISQLQMQAGLAGINTLRVYNPTKQLSDHDADCNFVRTEVPELGDRDPGEIHALPQLPISGYMPARIDYRNESRIYKGEYFAIKKSDAARQEADRVLDRHGSRLRGRRKR
jgi:deoxyribodipyrimidine photo-lyase